MSDKNYYPDYIGTPPFNHDGAPQNVDTNKLTYQKRMGVTPTTTSNLAFKNSREDGLLPMQRSEHVMEYTEINGRSPSAIERGTGSPPGQNKMGA